jgi:hypothetical protein
MPEPPPVTKITLFRKRLGRKIEVESTTGVTNGAGPGIAMIGRYANRYVAAKTTEPQKVGKVCARDRHRKNL